MIWHVYIRVHENISSQIQISQVDPKYYNDRDKVLNETY